MRVIFVKSLQDISGGSSRKVSAPDKCSAVATCAEASALYFEMMTGKQRRPAAEGCKSTTTKNCMILIVLIFWIFYWLNLN